VLPALPDDFAATRRSMHRVAEHVLGNARYRADGRIGLTPTPGGFGTPPYGDGAVARVEALTLVRERDGRVQQVALTTAADACRFLGVPPCAPAEFPYAPETPCDPEAPLALAPDAAGTLAAWFAYGDAVLAEVQAVHAAQVPTSVQLWPEHFDLGLTLGPEGARLNLGASPGDHIIDEPYLYASPWDQTRRAGPFGAYAFGAAITYRELRPSADPVPAGRDFLNECVAALLA
jgi:hypothetical protein